MMTRYMARVLRVPSPPEYISVKMNFPYYIMAAGEAGSYRNMVRFVPQVPMLFIYGVRKPFMFHSDAWADKLEAKEGCKVVAFNTDHWPMLRQPERFNEVVLGWLEKPADNDEAAEQDAAA